MNMYNSTISASRRTCLFAGLRHRLRNSCSVAVLGLAGATAFSGAANACQIDTTNPAEVIFSDGATVPCPTQNLDTYQNGANVTVTADGKIKGSTVSGTMTQNGPGTLILTGNSTYSGLTTIAAGTLQIGNGGTTGSVASDILNNSALIFNRADTLAYGKVISGTGSVEQKGPGTLILSADQTYAGGTTVSGGVLQLGNGGATGSVVGNILNNGAVAFNRSDNYTFGAVISGSGTMTQNGPGALILTGNNTYAGLTTITAGALQIGNGGTTGSVASDILTGPVTVANGGLMNVMSAQTVNGNILNNGTIDVGANVLSATGVYTQTAGATFRTAINYIGAGGYGQLSSAQALNVADGAILFASFASSEKYADGTIIQDVLKGNGTPTQAGKITLITQNQPTNEHYYWSAVWDGVNVDLVLKIYEGALPEPTIRTIKLDKGPILRLMHERFSMLNMVMDYDCAQFDKYGFCLSVQARATGFGTQSTGAGVFNMSYRLADRFRIGGYVDYQATYNSPSISGYPLENVHAYDNAPTFGGYAGYSETGYTSAPLQKGMQLFVSGGMNFGRISVARAMLNDNLGFIDAQPGSGTARLDAYYVRGVAGYGLDVGDGLRVMPYVGLRYTDVTRGGYVEGVNALVTQPLAYEAFYERLITGFGGAQIAAMVTPAMGVRAGLGAEVDFKRAANNYNGVSQIPGLPVFSLEHGGAWNGARPAANGGVFYNITPNQRVFLNGAAGQQAYTTRGYASGMLGYQAAF